MKFDYLKEKKELISVAFLLISVLFAALISMRITSFFNLSAKARNIDNIIRKIKAEDNNKPDDLNKYLSSTKEMANNLKKSNLFAPLPEKRNPITETPGIIGNEVFINNKWYKEGEMVQDAKIVRIEPAQVTIEWDGKTIVLRPLDAAMATGGPGGAPSGPGERPPSGPGNPPTAAMSRGMIIGQPPTPQGQPVIQMEKR